MKDTVDLNNTILSVQNAFIHPYMKLRTKGAKCGYITESPGMCPTGPLQSKLRFALPLWLLFPQPCTYSSVLVAMLFIYFGVSWEQIVSVTPALDHRAAIQKLLEQAKLYVEEFM